MEYIKKWHKSFLKSIQLQLFISFISLPFLIGWGLPISILTPISTLLFGPFLTFFLLVSSFIFFLELLSLPNNLLIQLLEYITHIWLFFLSYEQQSWLISFIKPPFILLLFLPCIAVFIIHYRKITTTVVRIIILLSALLTSCALLKLFPYQKKPIETIVCNKGEVTLLTLNNTLFLIDPGFLSSRPSYESYISYSLIPEIIQKKGVLHLDHCIVYKFNKRVLDALYFLADKISIQNIYFPAWQGKIPFSTWRSYVQLKQKIKENNGKLIPISSKKTVYFDDESHLFLEPIADKSIPYYDTSYKKLYIHGVINHHSYILE
jgi:hypothetical protein